jgi:hypothetical protein
VTARSKEFKAKDAARKMSARKRDPHRYKFQQIKNKYGITEQEWLQLLDKQGGHCACCPATEELCVDHCHTTGKVRGLLCQHCNRALGFFRDNPEYITNALNYLNDSIRQTDSTKEKVDPRPDGGGET